MKLNKALKSTMSKKFSAYCKYSTLHGVFYFCNKAHWWVYVIWAVIIGSSVSLCCFLGHMIWDKFAIDPTLTVVESTHYSVSNIPYPAVTVCDTEVIYGPNTVNITNLLRLRGYNSSQVDGFYMSFSEIKLKEYIPEPYIKKMHYLLDDLGYSFDTLLEMFKKPCTELLVKCIWRSKIYNCSSMFRSVYTIAGHCCQFDIPYFREHVSSEVSFISGVEETEGLDIIVNGQKKYRNGNIIEGYALLYVFDQKDRITLIDYPITLTTAAYFDVNIYVWAIDSSDNVKALSLSSRKCILDSEMANNSVVKLPTWEKMLLGENIQVIPTLFGKGLFYFSVEQSNIIDKGIGAGFYQGCLTRLILQKVVNHCRCLPFNITAKELGTDGYNACSWERLICIYGKIVQDQEDIKDIISLNQCYQKCDYVQYSTEVEYLKNHRHLKNLANSHSRVSVNFGETTCLKYRREVLYTWDQMLANLGGIFGLCLGGSIISILELLWCLIGLLFSILAVLRNKNVAPNENKIFTVTKKDMMTRKIPKKPVGFLKYKYMN